MTYHEHSREPLRPIVDTPAALEECLAALSAADGPVAFDTERAHGHRYWPKAYLLQIRREGAGTWLIDPLPFEDTDADLSRLVTACGDAVWLIHAASQDLPCMRELGILPRRIFDTELAARLLGKPGAALGALLSSELGINLRKAHSADNWSKRPLPHSWLTYAALDVDFLIELAETLTVQLEDMGRLDWVEQECSEELERYSAEPVPRVDPWRRLSGLTTLRNSRQLAVARALWLARDDIARRRDRPPGWILPDAAILDAATAAKDAVPTRAEIGRLRGFAGPPGQRNLNAWLRAIDEVRAMSPEDYPARRVPSTGVPNPRSWDRIDPAAASRWARTRPVVDALACDLGGLQPSLVAPPQVLQEALFHHPLPTADDLARLGARPWQVEFLAPLIAETLG
ncbi:MAG: HRDC domain-containing protein [Tessaracoccus sp.]|uniref:HRDC domain-containing protein n=1 Tax=Tessaracoccus sp. TaxID=1971211 RepID=UPI001EBCE967|nr:ribonuclease D [Tessaracoccus sp.]MBK7820309.1 HRDC domain-containing protein [Tessaracoccus sp.]